MNYHQIDMRQYFCPLPVIKLQSLVRNLKEGDTVEIVCTDPSVLHDIPAWCQIHGHTVLNIQENSQEITIQLKVHC